MLARALGQGLARSAEAMAEVARDLAADLSPDQAAAVAEQATAAAIPSLETLVTHVWRHHFAASVQRGLRRGNGKRLAGSLVKPVQAAS